MLITVSARTTDGIIQNCRPKSLNSSTSLWSRIEQAAAFSLKLAGCAMLGYGCWQRSGKLILFGAAVGAVGRILQPVEFRYRGAFENKENDLIRRIRGMDRERLLVELETLRDPSSEETAAFQKSEWTHLVFNDPDWPYLALRAYLDQKIDSYQTAKLFLFEAVQKNGRVIHKEEGGLSFYQVLDETGYFSKGRIFQIIDHQLMDREDGYIHEGVRKVLQSTLDLTNFEMEQLVADLKKLSPEETQFFLVDAAQLLSEEEYDLTVEQEEADFYNLTHHEYKSRVLILVDEKRKVIQQLVVPPRLYDVILKVKFRKNAMAPNPIFGYMKKDVLSDPQKRIQCIPCPFTRLPDKLHDLYDAKNPLSVYYHDQLHLFAESANPHRPIWIALALSFKESDPELCMNLLDRNFPLYSLPHFHTSKIGRDLQPDEIFWYNLPYSEAADPEIWKDEERIVAVLTQLQAQGIKLSTLLDCYEIESFACLFSLKPWADAARRILYEEDPYREEEPLLTF